MDKFSRTLRGYDPDEVNKFLDKVIGQVENMVEELKQKDIKIAELKKLEKENSNLREKLLQYERMEQTLNKAILMAQKTSEQIKINAHNESETVLEDAKRNANRIINEALIRAEKTEHEANLLKRNVNIFKKRVRDIVEAQLEIVDEIDEIEL